MPPRRRKAVCDEDEETVPTKKSCRQKTETQTVITVSAEKKRSLGSKKASSMSLVELSPAKKLRKKLNVKEGLDTKEGFGINCVDGGAEAEEQIESKYFRGGDDGAEVPRKKKETKSQSKLTSKQSDSGKREKLILVESQTVGEEAKRKGSKSTKVVSTSKGGREKEPKDEEMEEKAAEDISKSKRQKKSVSMSKTKADDGRQSDTDEVELNAKKKAKPSSAVIRPKKKSAPAGRGKGGKRGGRREGKLIRDEEGAVAEEVEEEHLAAADAIGSSSDSESEWEEVEELPAVDEDERWKSQLPDKPVQITFEASELADKKRKKKGGFDVKEYFRLQLNRFRTETQRNAHKVHLLCLLSHGRFRNSVCCNVTLQSIALSLVPPEFTDRSHDKWMFQTLTMFTRWFKKTILMDESEQPPVNGAVNEHLTERLVARFSERKALTEEEFILMFVISCRSIGLSSRLVYSLQPITFRPPDLKKNKNQAEKKKTEPKKKSENISEKSKRKTDQYKTEDNSQEVLLHRSSSSVKKDSSSDEDSQSEDSQSEDSQSEDSQSTVAVTPGGGGARVKTKEEMKVPPTEDNIRKTKNRRPRRSGSKVNYDEDAKDAELESEGEDNWKRKEMEDSLEPTSSNAESERGDGRDSGKSRRKRSSSDDDFEKSKVAFRRSEKKLMTRQSRRKERGRKKSERISSSDNCQIADDDRSLGCGSDWWTEVYLEKEEKHKWICVNGRELQVNHPESVEQRATKPLSYVLAFDNGDGIKDVTKKYASEWLASVKKIRLDESWWKDVLAPFQKEDCERDVKEEAYVHEQLLKKPMPTSVSAFKNHSLYALRRHLLKYEAIYPPSAPILGHIRGEPVYPRDCVHSLHAREKWSIEGRVVRIGEEPYKIVKARPKWNKPKEFNDRLKLPLFGRWQTEEFIPEPSVDGKIPKNEYGNVEVFKPWMIPGGTVYLPETMTGLGRVARKLDVDVAPAMVGWDFHNGFNHPILQGWIVCEEHRDVLVAAWEEDQAIQQQKEAEKKQQRILGNWKLLIKGLLIRERLKQRFNLQQEPTASSKKRQVVDLDADDLSEEENGQGGGDGEAKAETKEGADQSWPENLKTKKKKEEEEVESGKAAADNKYNLFPFEKDHQLSSSSTSSHKQ